MSIVLPSRSRKSRSNKWLEIVLLRDDNLVNTLLHWPRRLLPLDSVIQRPRRLLLLDSVIQRPRCLLDLGALVNTMLQRPRRLPTLDWRSPWDMEVQTHPHRHHLRVWHHFHQPGGILRQPVASCSRDPDLDYPVQAAIEKVI